MNNNFILVIIVILIGFIAKQSGLIKEKDGEGLSRVVFNFTLPAVIIDTFSTIQLDFSLIYLALISLLVGIALGILGFLIFRRETPRMKGMLLMPLMGFNIGLFAYPLVEAIWGKDIIKYFGIFDMGNSITVFILSYIVGAVFATGKEKIEMKEILKRISRSIPLIVYTLTILLRLLHMNYPGFILKISGLMAQANMPLSLLVLGMFLSFSFEKQHMRKIYKILVLKYLIGMLIGFTLFYLLPFSPYYRYTILVGVLLPPSLSIIPYAVEFEYDAKFVGTISNICIVISIIFMWGFSLFLK